MSFEVLVADRFALRLRGLSGLAAEELAPLLLPRCRSLHTFGMRVRIDVVWIDLVTAGEGEVLAIERALKPRRVARAPRSSRPVHSLELPGGAHELGLAHQARISIEYDF